MKISLTLLLATLLLSSAGAAEKPNFLVIIVADVDDAVDVDDVDDNVDDDVDDNSVDGGGGTQNNAECRDRKNRRRTVSFGNCSRT